MNHAVEADRLGKRFVEVQAVDGVSCTVYQVVFVVPCAALGVWHQSARRRSSHLPLKSETRGYPLFDVTIDAVGFTNIIMTRILLVSQPAIRCGLRMRLELEPDLAIVGEADDGIAALALASMHQPDVILIEMESIGVDSPRFITAIGTTSPKAAIVVLSFRDDPLTRLQMESVGAAALVSKHEDGNRLLQVIRAAAAGQHSPLGEQDSSHDVSHMTPVRKM